jgi:D-beta-D-heptose 7-phosphate kinase/D-beta-D-heptose 1-phosphate adenosyltransferase
LAPVLTLEQASVWARRLSSEGRSLVFTNGVFDLLHPGHTRYLADARAQGDALIVAVNSDRSVRANKGHSRPVLPERERAEAVAALRVVDAVLIFDDETPSRVIDAILPKVLVKGADWAEDAIVGRETVVAHGGRVVRVPVEAGHSTTTLIARARLAMSRPPVEAP